jgi:hypothetical protein
METFAAHYLNPAVFLRKKLKNRRFSNSQPWGFDLGFFYHQNVPSWQKILLNTLDYPELNTTTYWTLLNIMCGKSNFFLDAVITKPQIAKSVCLGLIETKI